MRTYSVISPEYARLGSSKVRRSEIPGAVTPYFSAHSAPVFTKWNLSTESFFAAYKKRSYTGPSVSSPKYTRLSGVFFISS